MKKLIITFANLLMITSLSAQSPEKMSYQAVIRDAEQNLVTNQSVAMQISIIQGDAFGEALYVETQTATTNANGLVSIGIGGENATIVKGAFNAIDWSNGPYFIKTETDPAGGTNYTISGTSQLLSVPYALHAKTAETITGGTTETDPVFTGSEAANITAKDITNLGNLSGTNTGDQDISNLATQRALADSTAQVRSEFPDVSDYITAETDPSVPSGTQTGEMQYWDGEEWITVSPGNDGQVLTFVNGKPTWKSKSAIIEVTNPVTGKTWMNKNLGSLQAATSSTDPDAYGDLFQWGRDADGHEERTSKTTTTLSDSDIPGHGVFITPQNSPYDWRSPQNNDLWQGISGTNNPCPSLYRLPTKAEWESERQSWNSKNADGAYASPLKLPMAGYHDPNTGSLLKVGSWGNYWSSTVDGANSEYLLFDNNNALMVAYFRAAGFSVRCIKDFIF